MPLFPKFSSDRIRPLSAGNAAVAFAVSAVAGLALASALGALAFSLGLGLDVVFSISSIVAFGIPGVIVRRLAVGRIKSRLFNANLFILVVLLAFACQPVVEWASAVDYYCAFKTWGDSSSVIRQNADVILSVCHFDSTGGFVLTVVVLALLPAVCEEVLFRGALIPVVRRLTGGWVSAVVISAVVFSLAHADVTGLLARTILGVLLGAVFVITRSVFASVVFHFFNNFSVVYNLYSADDRLALLTTPAEMPFVLVTLASLAMSVGLLYYMSRFASFISFVRHKRS